MVFFSEGFAAKEMTDYVYFRAYAVIDGKAYYSEVEKFSILEYVYQMREAGTMDENMSSLLTKMLDYGAAAQIVLNYKTDNLANASFVKPTAEGGAFEDGFTYGRFKVGSTVSLTAPEESGKLIFSHWENSLGENVSESAVYSFTVGNAVETYTAIYKKAPSQNLEYTLSADETYYIVSGIGTCKDTDIVIPSEYEGKPVCEIGAWAFENCDSLTSVVIPNSVTSIGDYAFGGCYSLTIYCEAESQPAGWNSIWNYSNRPVDWGYKGE